MNYQKHYDTLIERAHTRELKGYSEKHHIIPKTIGGTDDKDNLVRLTAREHFIAHILLVKIYPSEYGLIKAVQMMCVFSENHNKHRSANRMYSWLREKHSKSMSISQQGENNSQFGTLWVSFNDDKISKKIKITEFPDYEKLGWIKGRNTWKKSVKQKDDTARENAYKYWNLYKSGNYGSLREFANSEEYPFSQPNLVKQFNKHIDEYKT